MTNDMTNAGTRRKRRPTPAKATILRNARAAAGKTIRKVGRPSAYDPALCKPVMALGIQGKSLAGIAAALHIDKGTLIKWANEFPEFSNALARAKVYEQQWWEDKGQKALGHKYFQSQVWRTSMASRFRDDYTEIRDNGANGFDLAGFVGALGAGIAKGLAQKAKPGDDAKPIDVELEPPDRE